MPGAADHAIKVFGETDNQTIGLNGAIRQNPVMSGGRRYKKNRKSNKNNKKSRGGKRIRKNKTMRGGK